MRPRKNESLGIGPFLEQARHSLERQHLPRIIGCIKTLTQDQIWWRPHRTSNSVGNLVLHLEGNVRQWLISGLGNQPDLRDRDSEFKELGPIPRRALVQRLATTVAEACGILYATSPRQLRRDLHIQGFRVTGFGAVAHVTEHFAYHTGQIIYATKLLKGIDLGFTRLPGEKKKPTKAMKLSQF